MTRHSDNTYHLLQWLVVAGCILMVALLVALVNAVSLLSYFCCLLVSVLLYRWLAGANLKEAILLYAFYTFLMVIAYGIQIVFLPDYDGQFRDAEVALSNLYSQAWLLQTPLLTFLPSSTVHAYSRVLYKLFFFTVEHPLDVLFANALPLVLLPRLTYQLTIRLAPDFHVGQRAFYLVLICPLLLANSMALRVDGWMAMAFTGALLCLLRKDYIKLTILFVLLTMLSGLASEALTLCVVIMVIFDLWYRGKMSRRSLYYACVTVAIVVVAVALSLATQIGIKVPAAPDDRYELFRSVSDVIAMLQLPGISNVVPSIIQFGQQSTVIQVPLRFTYFFGAPFFSVQTGTTGGPFALSPLLATVVFPILAVLYCGYFVRGARSAWKLHNVALQVATLAFCVTLFVLSQLSTDVYRKAMLMPLFYVSVAYGSYQDLSTSKLWGNLSSGAMLLIQLSATIRFFS